MAETLHPLGQALRDERYDYLAGYLAAHFGVPVSAADLGRVCRPLAPETLKGVRKVAWSEGTWLTWFKQRLDDLGAFRTGDPCEEFVRWRTAVMHVFFCFIEETEAMWERLRAPEGPAPDPDRPARGKVFHADGPIHPIDRVAGRVAPGSERQ